LRPWPILAAFVVAGLIGGWVISGMKLPSLPSFSSGQTAAPAAPVLTEAQLQEAMQSEESQAATAVTAVIAPLITPDPSLPPSAKAMERQAFAGAAEAQHDLAALYTAGSADVAQDYARARDWFTLAARRGVANARYNLGVLYQQGLGTAKDTAKAVEYYRAAAFLGHPEALYNLGVAAQTGQGMDVSRQRANAYFTRAANLGLVTAALSLGQNGTDQDTQIFWYKLAADAGNAEAQTALNTLAAQKNLKSSDIMAVYASLSAKYPEAVNALAPPAAAVSNDPPPPPPVQVERAAPAANQNVAVVAQIQEQLSRQNLYIGQADGQMSTALRDAIKTYQQQNRLSVNGEASEDLLVHMLAREFSLDVDPTKNLAQ
jgi:TPR repeat protein